MKKALLSFVMFFVVLTGFAANASAVDLTRRFGVGVDSTIANYLDDGRGVSAVFYINKFFGLQVIFGLSTLTATIKDPNQPRTDNSIKGSVVDYYSFKTTITDWTVSLRGLIPIVLTKDVNLTGVVGFTACGRDSDGFASTDPKYMQFNDGYQFSIDLGVRPEYFFNDRFSIHTQVGIGISILTEHDSAVVYGLASSNEAFASTNASGAHMSFFKNVDLLGEAGFTFWF